jgi:RNA polymerase sigma-70 factor (ECF subfamily)
MRDVQEVAPEAWVDRYGDALYRYALLRLRSADLAADVVQDTFLEAFRVRHSFESRSTERTWLFGILRHKIIDQLRKRSREGEVPDDRSAAHRADDASPFDRRGHWKITPASWAGDPSRVIETREFWDAFSDCLAELPHGLADAFFLRELDELDSDEVQRILQISPANFWKRLHRARMLLRQCLESRWFDPRPRL